MNFEEQPLAATCFELLDIKEILKRLNYVYGQELIAGKSLLFLDEIQCCPQALKALRYFKEKLPELHIIAAGSLLEFILDEEELAFPVGRIRFINMKPLSFIEFLQAISQEQLLKLIEQASLEQPIPNDFHNHLLKFVKDYFLIGGMPQCINMFNQTKTYTEVLRSQAALLDVYRLDLGKYGRARQFPYLQRLFERAPELVAQHFRYSKIDPEASNPARDYKEAIRKLQQANIINSVHATSANGIPLRSEKNEKKFC